MQTIYPTDMGDRLSMADMDTAGDSITGGFDFEFGWIESVIFAIIILLVLYMIYNVSNLKQDRICVSTDTRDYWPSFLPDTNVNFPRLSTYLPESFETSKNTPDMLETAAHGY